MDAPMTKADLLAESASLVSLARKREIALLRGRMDTVDAVRKKIAAAVDKDAASAEDLASLRAELAIVEARLTAEAEACARRLDALENQPPRSWNFSVLRDPAGAISAVIANPI